MRKVFVALVFFLLFSGLLSSFPKTSFSANCRKEGETCDSSRLCCSPFVCTGKTTKGGIKTCLSPDDPLTGCPGGKSINSAIGCIPVLDTKEEFLSFILKWSVGIGGGIAFLLIVYAGFMIMTSAGNPERLKAGQELLTSAISGLILLIFSIVILKIIGVDILGLCNFGFGQC